MVRVADLPLLQSTHHTVEGICPVLLGELLVLLNKGAIERIDSIRSGSS